MESVRQRVTICDGNNDSECVVTNVLENAPPEPAQVLGGTGNIYSNPPPLDIRPPSEINKPKIAERMEGLGGITPYINNATLASMMALNPGQFNQQQLKETSDYLRQSADPAQIVNAVESERSRVAKSFEIIIGDKSSTDVTPDFEFRPQPGNYSRTRLEKTYRQRWPSKFSRKSREVYYFMHNLDFDIKQYGITEQDAIYLINSRLNGDLRDYFSNLTRRLSVSNALKRFMKCYSDQTNIHYWRELYYNFRLTFKDVSDEINSLMSTTMNAFPLSPIEAIEDLVLARILIQVPTELRRKIDSEKDRRSMMIASGTAVNRFSMEEVDQIIRIYKANNPNKFRGNQEDRSEFRSRGRINNISSGAPGDDVTGDMSNSMRLLINQIGSLGNKVDSLSTNMGETRQEMEQIKRQSPRREMYGSPEHGYDRGVQARNGSGWRSSSAGGKPNTNHSNLNRNHREKSNTNWGPYNNRATEDQTVKCYPGDANYGKAIRSIKEQNQKRSIRPGKKFMQLKVGEDIKYHNKKNNTNMKIKGITYPLGQKLPYNWLPGGYYRPTTGPITFPPLKLRHGKFGDCSEELLRWSETHCLRCGEKFCSIWDSRCVYSQNPGEGEVTGSSGTRAGESFASTASDSFYPCSACRRGMHMRQDCRALVSDEEKAHLN